MASVQFRPTSMIPSLEEIVLAKKCAVLPGTYSRARFHEFLRSSHCAENLEFILDVDEYIIKFNEQENVPFLDDEAILENSRLVKFWDTLYETYISRIAPKEVNVAGHLLDRFSSHILPEPKELLLLRKAVYELLSANYNDFVTSTRESDPHSRHHIRRVSETIAPEMMSPEYSPDSQYPQNLYESVSPDLSAQWEKTLEVYESSKLASSVESSRSQSRANSAGTISTRPSSRGSSLGSVFDNIREYSGWKKTVKRFRTRRASSEKPEQLSF